MHCDFNGSRTTNTSTNVSPSFNDNNSRTVLLSSDDIRTPQHQPRLKSRHIQMNPDSAAEYDEVASHSTLDESTPQTTSESASMSEIPSESRFKTFVKQKKKKLNGLSAQSNHLSSSNDVYCSQNDGSVEDDTDPNPSTRLLDERFSDQSHLASSSNGFIQDQSYRQHENSKRHSDHFIVNRNNSSQSNISGSNEDQENAPLNRPKEVSGQPIDDSGENVDTEDSEHDDEEESDDDDEDEDEDGDDEEAEEGVYDLSDGHVTGVQIS